MTKNIQSHNQVIVTGNQQQSCAVRNLQIRYGRRSRLHPKGHREDKLEGSERTPRARKPKRQGEKKAGSADETRFKGVENAGGVLLLRARRMTNPRKKEQTLRVLLGWTLHQKVFETFTIHKSTWECLYIYINRLKMETTQLLRNNFEKEKWGEASLLSK